MILDLLDSSLDGDSWEKLSISCYKMRYASEHFIEVPAKYKGDSGIEGFTESGIAIQCYCPEDRNLSDDDLYEHQRDKLTKDIGKFIDKENLKTLKKLGIPVIKEWHFVVPEIKDRRIIEHRTSKRDLVRKTRLLDTNLYDYISKDFLIIVKVAEDFQIELSSIVRSELTNVKLNLELADYSKPNWQGCENEKISNVKRKILAIQPDLKDNHNSLNTLLDMYMTFYMTGIEQFERLGVNFPDIRKELLDLANAYKNEVTIKTLFNTDKTLNATLFNELGNEFEKKLLRDFSFLSNTSIMNLKHNLIAGWLADCSMEFKGDV